MYVEINCPQSDQQNCQPGGSTSGSWIDVVVKTTPNGELMTVWDPNLPAGNGEPPFNLISTYHGLALNAAGHLLVGRDDRNMNEVNLNPPSSPTWFLTQAPAPPSSRRRVFTTARPATFWPMLQEHISHWRHDRYRRAAS